MVARPDPVSPPPGARHAGRNQGLELLRFALSFVVMCYHYLWYGSREGALKYPALVGDWMAWGSYGVAAFFVVSGLVIAWSAESRGWRDFAAARFGRLWPAMAVSASLIALVLLAVGGAPWQVLVYWAKSVALLPMVAGGGMIDGSHWSIAVELRFYALVALVLAFGRLHRLPEIVLAVTGLGWAALALGWSWLAEMLLWQYGGFFVIGVMLWRIGRSGADATAVVLLGAGTAAAMAGSTLSSARVLELAGIHDAALQVAVAVLVCLGLVVGAMRLPVPVALRPLAAILGGISYPLYLLHQTAGYHILIVLSPRDPVAATLLVMAAMVATALGVHLLAERPLAPRARRWAAAVLNRLPVTAQGGQGVRG